MAGPRTFADKRLVAPGKPGARFRATAMRFRSMHSTLQVHGGQQPVGAGCRRGPEIKGCVAQVASYCDTDS